MTIEEKADAFLNKDDKKVDDYLDSALNGLKLTIKQAGTILGLIKAAYIVGAKENAPQWHDLRKNPKDLPKPNIAVLICMQFEKWTATYIAYYRPAGNKWQMCNISEAQRGLIIDDYIDRDEVIAWCEIPKFEEEQ